METPQTGAQHPQAPPRTHHPAVLAPAANQHLTSTPPSQNPDPPHTKPQQPACATRRRQNGNSLLAVRRFLVVALVAFVLAPPAGAATVNPQPVRGEIARQVAATYPGLAFGNVA